MSKAREALAEARKCIVSSVHMHGFGGRVLAQIDAALAEPEAAPAAQAGPVQGEDAKDAARYRWLASRLFAADFQWGDPPQPVLVFTWPASVGVGGNCNQNVDAAMSALASSEGQQPGGGDTE